MAKVKFYLKRPDQKESSIYTRISYGTSNQMKYYISESIQTDFWNIKTSRAKETKEFPQHPEFNHKLDNIESMIKNTILNLQNRNIGLTNDTIKTALDTLLKPEIQKIETVSEKGLFEFIEHFISTSTLRKSSIKSYRVVQNNLVDYQKKHKTKKLTFENIDIDFYNSFIEFLKKRNYATNTIGTRIKVVKTIMRNAQERDIKVSQDYTKKAFKKPKEDVDHIYLTEAELDKIYNVESTPEFKERLMKTHNGDTLPEYLDRAKDIFLIGCYTGLRFSDLSQLKRENFLSDNTIQVKTIKTAQEVVIPIHPIVKQILNKYNYQLPKVPLNQVFNRFIKEVGYLADISEIIGTEITKGGLVVKESTEKYKLIASHTARRSFATNAYLADMPSISIMKITAHKTESAFMKYIKMSAKDNAIKMQMHPFFNKLIVAK